MTTYNTKMLGLVTLYNPNPQEASENIKRYIHDIDKLIIWDNSPIEANIKQQVIDLMTDEKDHIVWHGDGQNKCIAPAINFAWKYAKEQGYDLLLIMDQDSHWANFSFYREKVEHYYLTGNKWTFVPYIAGNDNWVIFNEVHFKRVFINSGTIIPIEILNAIDGADETFALDALDHDLAIRIQKAGYQIACITCCMLYHTVGHPKRSRFLNLFTNDYGRERTYSIAKTHLIKYRKHKSWFTAYEKRKIFKEYYMWKLIRIIFAEEDKLGRLKMLIKGIWDGMNYDLKKTKR